MIADGQTLRKELLALGAKAVEGPKSPHMLCPSTRWLDLFGPHVVATRPSHDRRRYDCVDHAFRAVALATEMFQKSDVKFDTELGHAFGLCRVGISQFADLLGVPGDGATHMLNIARTPELGWVFFEPQNGLYCEAPTALGDGRVLALHFVFV